MIIGLAAMAMSAASHASVPACSILTASQSPTKPVSTEIRPEDLAGLRDIGVASHDQASAGISVSPDGKWIAFQLKTAVPALNAYCLEIVVVSTGGDRAVRTIDHGSEVLLTANPQFEYGPYPTGIPEVVRPLWSPDGKAVAYLKRMNGQTKATIAYLDGRPSVSVDHGSGDAVGIAWDQDSRSIQVTAVQWAELERKRDVEGLSGYRLDDRFIPAASSRPYLTAPFPTVVRKVALPPSSVGAPAVGSEARPASGWVELTAASDKQFLSVTERLGLHGIQARCVSRVCSGKIVKVWTSRSRKEVIFLRREGALLDQYVVYHWSLKSGEPLPRYRTKGLLIGCEAAAATLLVCAREESTRPRHIISLEPRSGKVHDLYDPNPEFAAKAFGTIERLYWKNDQGIPAYADFVLPPNHRPNDRHPLIVVSYDSRGFLRGGTGDEYPIFALAARGYAVMSFDIPPDIGSFAEAKSGPERAVINRKDWANRRSVQSSLETGIELIEKKGVTIPSKRGITGFSDGSSTLWFALINSTLFQAAAVSHCCEEPGSMAMVGSRTARYFEQAGFPGLLQDKAEIWGPMSVIRNADRIKVPILLNLSSTEYRWSLESIRALRAHGTPIDAYVFPEEYHVKWQPAHRLAIYKRNIAWFDYWLRGIAPIQSDNRALWQQLAKDSLAQ